MFIRNASNNLSPNTDRDIRGILEDFFDTESKILFINEIMLKPIIFLTTTSLHLCWMINIGSQKTNYFLDARVDYLYLVKMVWFNRVMNNRCAICSERRCFQFRYFMVKRVIYHLHSEAKPYFLGSYPIKTIANIFKLALAHAFKQSSFACRL